MSREDHTPGAVAHDVRTFVASHPRFVLTVALAVLFVATQGTVGAQAPAITPDAGASSYTGP